MKKCPKCGYIVVRDNYCKICKSCVIYEEHIIAQETKVDFNKYIFLYYFKRLISPVISAIIVLIFIILSGGVKNQLIIFSIIFNILSFISGIFEEWLVQINSRYEIKEYTIFKIRFFTIIYSITAILLVVAGYSNGIAIS